VSTNLKDYKQAFQEFINAQNETSREDARLKALDLFNELDDQSMTTDLIDEAYAYNLLQASDNESDFDSTSDIVITDGSMSDDEDETLKNQDSMPNIDNNELLRYPTFTEGALSSQYETHLARLKGLIDGMEKKLNDEKLLYKTQAHTWDKLELKQAEYSQYHNLEREKEQLQDKLISLQESHQKNPTRQRLLRAQAFNDRQLNKLNETISKLEKEEK
jgi:hypothetical protein